MAIWVRIEDEDDFFLWRSTLRSTLEKRHGILDPNVVVAYERLLRHCDEATRDQRMPTEVQEEVGAQDPAPPKKQRAKRGEGVKQLPKLCKDHPTYGGKRRPRVGGANEDCETCWNLYEKFNGKDEAARKKADLARRSRR